MSWANFLAETDIRKPEISKKNSTVHSADHSFQSFFRLNEFVKHIIYKAESAVQNLQSRIQ